MVEQKRIEPSTAKLAKEKEFEGTLTQNHLRDWLRATHNIHIVIRPNLVRSRNWLDAANGTTKVGRPPYFRFTYAIYSIDSTTYFQKVDSNFSHQQVLELALMDSLKLIK